MPKCSAELLLIGNEKQLAEILGRSPEASSIRVVHASEVIEMGEAGAMAVRKKRGASLNVAMRLLAEGEVDAVVSAGNSGAIVAAAKHLVGLIPGLQRPAMAVALPTPTGKVLLVDAGAQAEAKTIHLAQSAALANVFLRVSQDMDRPRVGLLNIGQEPLKGMRVIQRAFSLLERSSLHFIGNIEPQDLYTDRADAAICDGFVGNLLLKMYEGLLETLLQSMEAHVVDYDPDTGVRVGQTLRRFRGDYDYRSVGGAPLLGVRKTVMVAHGRSRAEAIANAILLASRLAGDKVCDRISAGLEKDGILADLRHHSTALMLEQFKSKWRFPQRQSSADQDSRA
jgi:glycerol-3-phosphate acyltransferase PlsX